MFGERRRRRIREVAGRRQQGVIVLQDVHDPHNLTAVLRTAEAFGFQEVVLLFEEQRPYRPRAKGRSPGASAVKWLDFRTSEDTDQCLGELRERGLELVAAVADPAAEALFGASFDEPGIALLIGNEHRGLSERALAFCTRRITIPLLGMTRSLNLSVAAGIILAEVCRQRAAAGAGRALLPEAERRRLEQDFLRRAEPARVRRALDGRAAPPERQADRD